MSFNDAMRGAVRLIELSQKNEQYKYDAALWAKDVLGIHMWSKQREIAEALIDNKKVAVASCHGSGKSFTGTVLILWWVCTRMQDDTIAMVTAPTFSQIHNIIFEAMRKLHAEHNLVGNITLDDSWKDDNGNVVAFGRKPADSNAHAFQGIHRTGGVYVTIDEACGVDETIFTGAEAVTTGRLDRILAIFNPDDVQSYIGKAWQRQDPSWHFLKISAFDTPNFTGEWVPSKARNGLISPEWVEEKKVSWGEDSPRYKSKVLGEFSEESSSTLFSLGTLNKGAATELEIGDESTPILGVDVARMGEDYSVVYSYQDGVLRLVDKWSKANAVETAERIVRHAHELGAREVRIDGVGLGGPVIDFVAAKSDNRFETIGIIGNAASPDLDKWINSRAYFYDDMRERMSNGEIDIDFDDKDLQEELGDLQYHFKNTRSALQIEKKEDIRLRTGKSPDFADAAMYACANLGIDPTDPINKLRPGDQYEWDISEILDAQESVISPF